MLDDNMAKKNAISVHQRLKKIFPNKRLINTASGSFYHVIGDSVVQVQLKEFELLRHGF
ncbi:hypothetical protein [Alteromonas sp. H39]|uniref:hypothetical protein n=1 Tax=Alteromonas sp. H39 TaxID=3389876 RepID=UPI0039E07147